MKSVPWLFSTTSIEFRIPNALQVYMIYQNCIHKHILDFFLHNSTKKRVCKRGESENETKKKK